MVIVSTIAGRIRVRSKRLKFHRVASNAQQEIASLNGVTGVRVNPEAGSLVVHYDTETVDTEELEDQIEGICEPPPRNAAGNGNGTTNGLNRITKVGMMSTLTASVTYGVLGKKRPHIAYGATFLVFAGLHMLKYSNRLVR